ncbi:MAG: prephenate dehydrogenase/arogenate dehydrogenase family protein [bacterium]|nr:prephenate dehydrogenase/arogenate dehydrogenase family protein [bacterium]
MKNLVIGIIGAKGKMGEAFVQLFRSQGCEVLEADISTELSGKDLIQQADITIFSVPITAAVGLIRELAPHAKSGALLSDFTAIKTPAVQAMREAAPKSCEILGLHPIFGPGVVQDMSQQVIAACPVRAGDKAAQLLQFFTDQGAQIKETSPEEHDRMMSLIQGVTHVSAIATAMAMKKLGVSVSETLEYASPIYKLRLEMVGRILSQGAQLYAEIAVENPLTKESIGAYLESIQFLKDCVVSGHEEGFIQAFREAAEYLGDFKEEAYRKTSKLIKQSKNIL